MWLEWLKSVQKNPFWVALLLHILLLLAFSLSISVPTIQQTPAKYILSYAYNEEKSVAAQAFSERQQKSVATSLQGIKKPAPNKNPTLDDRAQQTSHELSEMFSVHSAKNSEAVHLLGEKGVPKPLIVLIGKALTAKLVYPKIASDLNVQGTAVIGFNVYPDGRVDHVQLLKSSHASVLDQAAVDAGNAISPVRGVAEFLDKTKFMVIGIIFR